MKLLIVLLVTCSISPSFAEGLISPAVEEMNKVFNEKEHQAFNSGQIVTRKQNVNKSSWPRLTFYFLINATPLESVSTFAAFEHQKNYVPELLESMVVNQISPVVVDTKYKMNLPWPLSDSEYVHRTHLKTLDVNTFRVDWTMIESDTAEKVEGFAEFYPLSGKTLCKYQSFINPKSFLAGLFKKTMIKDVKASLEAIRNEIMRVKSSPEKKQFVRLLKDALQGKFAYPSGQPAK